jgi:hypothetical protein
LHARTLVLQQHECEYGVINIVVGFRPTDVAAATIPAQPLHERALEGRDVVAKRKCTGLAKVGQKTFAAFPERENFDRFSEQTARNPPLPGATNSVRYRQIYFHGQFLVTPNFNNLSRHFTELMP